MRWNRRQGAVACIGIAIALVILVLLGLRSDSPLRDGRTLVPEASIPSSERNASRPSLAGETPAKRTQGAHAYVIDERGLPAAGLSFFLQKTPDVQLGRTAENGALTLPAQVAALDSVALLLKEQSIFTSTVTFSPAKAPNLIVHRKASLTLLTVDTAGATFPGAALVVLDGTSIAGRQEKSNAQGVAQIDDLRTGDYYIWAHAKGLSSKLHLVRADPEAKDREIRIPMKLATVLSGRIVDDAGLGVKAKVRLQPIGHEHAPMSFESDTAGYFNFDHLPSGRWQLRASSDTFWQPKKEIISALPPTTGVQIRMERKGSILGDVVDPEGNPLPGAQIVLSFQGELDHENNPYTSTSTSSWSHPLTGERFLPLRASRKFGAQRPGARPIECGRGHCGVDLGSQLGSPVVAASDGKVVTVQADDRGKAGRYIAIEHISGFTSFYMHLDRIAPHVQPGVPVLAGTLIGTLGRSGIQHSKPHLHFALALRDGGRRVFVDPGPILHFAKVWSEARLPLSVEGAMVLTKPSESKNFSLQRKGTSILSDTNGAFAYDGLVPGRYRITAAHRDFASPPATALRIHSGAMGRHQQIQMLLGSLLDIRVGSPIGPIAGAWVRIYQGQGESRQELSFAAPSSSGTLRIGPLIGAIEIAAGAPGYGTLTRKITLKEKERPEELFVLSAFDSVLRGQVNSSIGHPAKHIELVILSGPGGVGRKTRSDNNGRFQFSGVPQGEFSVVLHSDKFPKHIATIEAVSENTITMPAGGALRIALIDAHQRGAISALSAHLMGPKKHRVSKTSDAQGQLWFPALLPGQWKVHIDSPPYIATVRTLSVREGDSGNAAIPVELHRGATLGGVVRDETGERVADVEIWVDAVRSKSDTDGVFLLERVPTGNVTLRGKSGKKQLSLPLSLHPGDKLHSLDPRLRLQEKNDEVLDGDEEP